jgi:hypothetical protein
MAGTAAGKNQPPFFLTNGGHFLMHLAHLKIKVYICEVCGNGSDNGMTVGVESDSDIISPIRLCHRCGPINIDLMQLCREITIACISN